MARLGKKKKRGEAHGPQSELNEQMTLLEHVDELKNRLFWVAVIFIVASACVYPFFEQIIAVITAPVGDSEMYYFTVTGGLSFIIKICMYTGIIAAIPALVYHIYKFIAPVMSKRRSRSVAIYTISSALLALVGIAFSYIVILPAALKFLTDFSFGQINGMLSIDSYVSFVIAYLIAGALLFQLPVILLAINNIHRLPPKKLLSYERFVIVGAFIFAAILSPTPDAINQAMMAAPIIVMYQVGIVLVWWSQRREAKKLARSAKRAVQTATEAAPEIAPTPVVSSGYGRPLVPAAAPTESALASTSMAFTLTNTTLRPTHAPKPQSVQPYATTISPRKPQTHVAMIQKPQAFVKKPPTGTGLPQKVAARPSSPRPVVDKVTQASTLRPLPRTLSPKQQIRPLPARPVAKPSVISPRASAMVRPHVVQPTARPRHGIDGFGAYAST